MSYTEEDSRAMHAHWAAVAKYGLEPSINVFYLDHDAEAAARAHHDRHVGVGAHYAARLLSTAWHVLAPGAVDVMFIQPVPRVTPRGELPWLAPTVHGQRIYRAVAVSNELVQWVCAAQGNYDWLWRLGIALLEEHQRRFKRTHVSAPVFWTLEAPPPRLAEGLQTEPPCAMAEALRVDTDDGYVDAVRSYRNYYVKTQQGLMKWTNSEIPEWLERVGELWVEKEAPDGLA